MAQAEQRGSFQMMRGSVSSGAGLRFQIVEALGNGGFGAVYEAIDARTGQRVALKELDDASAASISRFKQEFRALSDCHHPNLVSLKELIEDDGRWYIVMELVPGSDFLTFVRGVADNDNHHYDEARLRGALRGIAEGLFALHGYGILHRDLKPLNVRVTPEGRAVLLDFGLVTSVDPMRQSNQGMTLGTVPYMAPEQATNVRIGPAADWYAFGACLFEALTGRWPIEGESPFHVLAKKQQVDAPRASSLVAGVPPDLDELCSLLLDRTPETRAGAREAFAILGWPADARSDLARPGAVAAPVSFAGREPELLQLQRALARSVDGAFKLLLVEGESGVGKSELVAEFIQRARAEQPELTVLHGRCYENEQVSYKAFDGCIDELSRIMRHLPASACAQLLPPRAALLGQLFPVLRGIGAIARAPRGESSAEPTARRLEAFAALAALFSKLSEERPLVLVIDDLQWADAESFRLLLALAQRPEPPPVLIVATIRPPEELEPTVAEGLEAFRRQQRIDVVPILGLPPNEAAALARKLLGPDAPEKYCLMIAEESGGHPLFLSELVQFARSHDLLVRGTLTLEAALRARIEQLDERSRELLEMVAVAGRPYSVHILARALGRESVDEQVRRLLSTKLLRVRKGQELGSYHDRIRSSVVSLIAKSRIAPLHRQLANALSSDPLSDALEQARHWDLAGESERAVEAYERAAQAALGALAFMRVTELCARATQLIGNPRDERSQRLLVMNAHALACAGRSAESAVLYERATHGAAGEARSQLRARHAQQLMFSGKLELGTAVMRALLSELGINFPKSTAGTLLHTIFYRLWLALRGDEFHVRAPRVGEEQLAFTTKVLRIFAMAVGPLHPVAGMLVSLRAVRLAAKLPLRENILVAYARMGWMHSIGGSSTRAAAMFEKSRALAVGLDSSVSLAAMEFAEGSACLLNWDYERAAECLERAQHLLRTSCPDEPAQLRNVRYHLGITWYGLGAHARLARESEGWLAEARERDDQLSLALLTGIGYGFLPHLQRAAPDDALRAIESALRELPKEPFSFVHFGELTATVTVLLYKGGAAAHDWLTARAAEHARPMLLRSPLGRQTLSVYRGLAALRARAGAAPSQRAALLKLARKEAHSLMRSRAASPRVFARLLEAQVHAIEGRPQEALAAARAAAASAPPYECQPRLLARYLEALLETGSPSSAACLEGIEFLRSEGWREPLTFLQALLPALNELTPQTVEPRARGDLLLGRYEVVRTLGSGGFGTVVEARDVQTGRSIALKELVSKHPRSLERFKQEFRTLADLHHANLVRLEELLHSGTTWYIAMELLGGESLLVHTRPLGTPDRANLSAAFVGVVDGLGALHEAGFAHRDVTPDNVCVTAEGRAVLLDFGLIGRLDDACDEGAVGSLDYAAPEQLAGARPSSAADVYSLGSCLYQALAGRLPFSRMNDEPPPHAEQPRRAPPPLNLRGFEDLERLVQQMLALDPAARPSLAEVRARLCAQVSALPTMPPPTSPLDPADRFSGREAELEQLAAAYERTCEQGLSLVLVEGESGLGKSALVSEFGRRVQASVPNAIVLNSRCYESEQVAFKAFDAAVDQLARALRALPSPTCEALLPKRAALLGELFPVLNSVATIAQAPKKGLPADPGTRQRAAIVCFVQLLASLTKHFELLFLIDDLQWADAESFRLLQTLLEQRSSLPLSIVCTVRPATEVAASTASELALLRASNASELLALDGLSELAATKLVAQLNGGPLPPERMARLLHEAKGHPLFLRELVEQERMGVAAPGSLTLDSALRARIERFDESARTLLALVALAGKPYGVHVFARALRAPAPPRDALVTLLGSGFLRRSGATALAVYHDRIARAALALLPPDQLRVLAHALASALDLSPRVDAAECARLWEEAGDAARAISAYERAGDGALQALQFTLAAHHYGRAVDLLGDVNDERQRALLLRRGKALVCAGRSAEAAQIYRSAAERAQGETAIRLRILAAEQSLHSGQAEQGMAAVHALLAELGIPVPMAAKDALALIVWNRAKVALRGYGLRKPRAQTAPRTRAQLDAAWSLATPFTWLDPLGGIALGTLHLRLALASGEPSHVARALAAEAFARAMREPSDRTIDKLIVRARDLAAQHGDPALEAEVTYREGVVALYRWDLVRASECLDRALSSVTERCPDQPWLTTNIRLSLGAVWFNRGEHRRLAQAGETWLAEARDRGDQFALTNLNGLGYAFLRNLMADDPDRVEADVEGNRPLWPREPFSFVHFGDLLATNYQLLYRGGDAALSFHERHAPQLSRALILRSGTGRSFMLLVRAAAHLAAWSSGPRAGTSRLLADTRALIGELASVGNAFARHSAPFLMAQIHVLEGQGARALATLRRVHAAARECGYTQHADRAEYLAALVEGGASGLETRARLLAAYAEQGWKQPHRAMTMLCPILDVIEDEQRRSARAAP
jgi:serine/threonine protein kinase/predicted ATPase